MAESYVIDGANQIVISRAWGEVTTRDLVSHYSRPTTDPHFRRNFRQLIDITEATGVVASSESIRQAARMDVFEPGRRRAVVATRDIAFGSARMFALYAEMEGQEIRVFRNRQEALEWLGFAANWREPAPDI